ncbi:MAG: fatty acid desaturase [Vicinamibacterales bacterium]
MSTLKSAFSATVLQDMDATARDVLRDLHTARSVIFWSDLLANAAVGWTAFVVAITSKAWSAPIVAALLVASLTLYRCLCFTHEITHLRRGSLPGFETTWNLLIGVPLLLPSFAYVGVHQSHHSLSTYGTKDDPEYLPFATSRAMIAAFALQSSIVLPLLLFVRFVVLAPIGLLIPPFHRWLERHASSFSMNPSYRRDVPPAMASSMRRWEALLFVVWSATAFAVFTGRIPARAFYVWLAVMVIVSFLNTLRVLGAHEYDSDGQVLDRHGQLADSIDTPGGPWTTLWAPVGLRYHALHHYFPGIPYHNLGQAYRRLLDARACRDPYALQSSRSIGASLWTLYHRAAHAAAPVAPAARTFTKTGS